VLGEGEYRPELEARARALGVADRVMFEGWVAFDEVAIRIAAADLCVVPASAGWLLPNKLTEYIAMKKPVVAARTPTMTSMFDDSMVRYFTPADPTDLAAAIVEVYQQPEAAAGRVARAYQSFYARRWDVTRRLYLDLHEQLAPLPQAAQREEALT
jgi:glycosyltransferase involved in cell wall biosynthesis